MNRKIAAKNPKKRISPIVSTTLFQPRPDVFFALPSKEDQS
jgi:hypothetical protein